MWGYSLVSKTARIGPRMKKKREMNNKLYRIRIQETRCPWSLVREKKNRGKETKEPSKILYDFRFASTRSECWLTINLDFMISILK